MMQDDGSITHWIANLNAEDAGKAQEEIWKRYFHRLLGLAKNKLADSPRLPVDAEDVAVDALNSFFRGAGEDAFPLLKDRHGLWPLLAKITSHKAIDHKRRWTAKKRNQQGIHGDSIFRMEEASDGKLADALIDNGLRPDFLVALNEQCRMLMERLPNDQMRQIARMRLEGYANPQIAKRLDVSPRTVERKLAMIRDYWRAELVPTE